MNYMLCLVSKDPRYNDVDACKIFFFLTCSSNLMRGGATRTHYGSVFTFEIFPLL